MSQYFMEWLRGSATEGGAATYGETELKTPVGRANNLAMAIHKVEFQHQELDTIAAGDDFHCHLSMNSKSAVINLDSSDAIALWVKHLDLSTNGAIVHDANKSEVFYPPLLYAKSSIYLGIKTTGQAAAKTVYARIGYTLRFVSATRMVQALVD
jgi:hypothetical protein